MGDPEVYGWEYVRAFHAAWLLQLEHCHIMWADEETKLKFMKGLINLQ